MYQIGLVSVSFRGLSPEEIIRIAKDAGLNRMGQRRPRTIR